VQQGVEHWIININPGSTTGKYTYTDTAVLNTNVGVAVYLDGKAEGDADVTLMSDGTVSMHLRDTKHSFNAHTNIAGHGKDTPAPLRVNVIVWTPGADCP
jgi:hypothetical protein